MAILALDLADLIDFIVIWIKSGLHCCNFSFHFSSHSFSSACDTTPSIICKKAIMPSSIGLNSFIRFINKVSSAPRGIHRSISFHQRSHFIFHNVVILKAQVTPTEEVLKVRFKLGQLFELVRCRWARHIRRKPF